MAVVDLQHARQLKLDREVGSNLDEYAVGSVMFSKENRDDLRVVSDIEVPTPADLDRLLDTGGIAQSLGLAITLPTRSAPRRLCPVDVPPKQVEELTDMLTRSSTGGGMSTSLETIVGQLSTAYALRRTYMEKVIIHDRGRFVYKKVAWRPPASCQVVQDKKSGDIVGFEQTVAEKPEPVLIERPYALVYVHGEDRKPIRGVSRLKVAYDCWVIQQKIEFLWWLYLENYAMPRTVIWGKNEDGARDAATVLAKLRSNGVVGIPVNWAEKMDSLPVAPGGSSEYANAIKFLDSRASRSVLMGFLGLPDHAASGTGSYALSKDQSDFALQLLTGFANETATCVTKDLIADLSRLNYGRSAPVPPFEIGPLSPETVDMALNLLKEWATVPNLRVPDGFVEDLTMEAARRLGLNQDKVKKDIEENRAKRLAAAQTITEAETSGAAAAADVGYDIVAGGGQ